MAQLKRANEIVNVKTIEKQIFIYVLFKKYILKASIFWGPIDVIKKTMYFQQFF